WSHWKRAPAQGTLFRGGARIQLETGIFRGRRHTLLHATCSRRCNDGLVQGSSYLRDDSISAHDSGVYLEALHRSGSEHIADPLAPAPARVGCGCVVHDGGCSPICGFWPHRWLSRSILASVGSESGKPRIIGSWQGPVDVTVSH